MKKNIFLFALLTVIGTQAQNVAFNNVLIGIDAPVHGIQIKTNFLNYNGPWVRAYSIMNETGNQSFFTFGSSGQATGGVTKLTSNFIGKDLYNRYMTFLPNGNIGIGTDNPNSKFEVISEEPNTLEVAGFYNSRSYGATNDKSETRINIGKIEDKTRQPMGAMGAFPENNATSANGNLAFYIRQNQSIVEAVRIDSKGNMGIGTIAPDERLTVKGKIHAQEIRVDLDGPLVPDYVFAEDYKLKTLKEVEDYIKQNNHLPEIPSAREVEKNGLMLAEMNMNLLKKIEEMTLYIIEQNKQIIDLNKRLEKVESK